MRRMLTERTVSVMTVKIKSSLTLTAALMCFHERLVSWFWVLQYSGLVLSRFPIAVSVTKFCTTRERSETLIRCWRAETSRGLWLDPVWLGSARQGLASPSQRGLPAWMGVHPGVWQSISPSGSTPGSRSRFLKPGYNVHMCKTSIGCFKNQIVTRAERETKAMTASCLIDSKVEGLECSCVHAHSEYLCWI